MVSTRGLVRNWASPSKLEQHSFRSIDPEGILRILRMWARNDLMGLARQMDEANKEYIAWNQPVNRRNPAHECQVKDCPAAFSSYTIYGIEKLTRLVNAVNVVYAGAVSKFEIMEVGCWV